MSRQKTDACPSFGLHVSRHDDWGDDMRVNIEDLVNYRFDKGRPFSTIGGLAVGESEQENRL